MDEDKNFVHVVFFFWRDSKNTAAQIMQWSVTMCHNFMQIFYRTPYPLFVGVFNPRLAKDKTMPQKVT